MVFDKLGYRIKAVHLAYAQVDHWKMVYEDFKGIVDQVEAQLRGWGL